MLAAYGIHSKTVRMRGGTPKGFDEAQFKDAFERYLTPPYDLSLQSNDTHNPSCGAVDGVSDDLQHAIDDLTPATSRPKPVIVPSDVADNS